MIWEVISNLSDSVMAQREGWVGDATIEVLQQHRIPSILLYSFLSPSSFPCGTWESSLRMDAGGCIGGLG